MEIEIKCEYTEMQDVDLIVEHPRNSNKHGEKQIELLGKILQHQGWRAPLVISKRSGLLVSGHGRLMAAKYIGLKEVPVSLQDFENEAQEIAHLIADNKIAALAEHDDAFMIDVLKDLELEDMDFDLLGMPDFNLMQLLDGDLDMDDKPIKETDDDKKYIIEVQFTNDNEMNDIKDDLLSRGYIVKVR